MGMADRNFFSITGNEAGDIWINDIWTFKADEPGMRELILDSIVAPPSSSDCLKFSGTRRLRVRVIEVDGRNAAEDAVDINHCQDLDIIIGTLYAGQTYCATIKGGSQRIHIQVDKQIGHGRETDYDLGNFADQGNAKTIDVSLNIKILTGAPVKVRVLTANKPIIENPSQHYDISGGGLWSRLFYPLFNWVKDLLNQFGIKI